jgi:hypothetical protein
MGYLSLQKRILSHRTHKLQKHILTHHTRAAHSVTLKTQVDSTLTKTSALRININIDGTPITSKTHTHPSHSQTSRLLTSSLSLGVPVPHTTQCLSGVLIIKKINRND